MNNDSPITSTRSADYFRYALPPHLIARYPSTRRGLARMMVLNRSSGAVEHKRFGNLTRYLRPGDVLVLNNTGVVPARLHAQKESGGRVELLVEQPITTRRLFARIKASRAPKIGSSIQILRRDGKPSGDTLCVVGLVNDAGSLFELALSGQDDANHVLSRHGTLALPPYIKRFEEPVDRRRYHTVFAKHPGAIAAPTAGLHFSQAQLKQLKSSGVDIAYITLHVGYATFAPVRSENLLDHTMHAEHVQVSAKTCTQIKQCRARQGRVIAVGTTVVRALETAAECSSGEDIQPYRGKTQLFIYPGYKFKVIDGLLTNFHQPGTTLLLLVAAFAGATHIMNAYREAVACAYRFLSYGDAMLIGDWDADIY